MILCIAFISNQVPSISICCIVSLHPKRIILNNTERFYVFSFLHYMWYIYYDNVKLETHYDLAVNDLRTSSGTLPPLWVALPYSNRREKSLPSLLDINQIHFKITLLSKSNTIKILVLHSSLRNHMTSGWLQNENKLLLLPSCNFCLKWNFKKNEHFINYIWWLLLGQAGIWKLLENRALHYLEEAVIWFLFDFYLFNEHF